MPPRRHVEIFMPNPAVERDMREIHARLDAMEKTQRRETDDRDVNEDES